MKFETFLPDFRQTLLKIAEHFEGLSPRDQISRAYEVFLSFITRQFAPNVEMGVIETTEWYPTIQLIMDSFAARHSWSIDPNKVDSPANAEIQPIVIDQILQEFVKLSQGPSIESQQATRELFLLDEPQEQNGKKLSGSFFTPPQVARILTQQVLWKYVSSSQENSKPSVIDVAVLDPAMGSGIFLVEFASILLDYWAESFPEKTRAESIREILANHLFGIDLLPEAVVTAKARLLLWAASQLSSNEVPEVISGADVGAHLLCDDALTTPASQILNALGRQSFPIIIGNPPFVHTRTGILDKTYKRKLKKLFPQVARGQWDLSMLFVRRIGDLMSEGGHWGFVLPTRFLSNEHYQPARDWVLEQFSIHAIVDIGKAFSDAGVEVIFLSAGPKLTPRPAFILAQLQGNEIKPVGEMDPADAVQFPFHAIPWIPQPDVRAAVLKINANPRRLGDLVTITRGFECGFHDPVVGSLDQLLGQGHQAGDLLPIIKGTHIAKFSVDPGNQPTYAAPDWTDPAKFKTRDLFLAVPKIVVRFVANDIVAGLDRTGYVNTNGVYNLHPRPPLTRDDLRWVLSLMNSAPANFWFKIVFANRDKIYPHVQKNQLERIPIPESSPDTQEILSMICDHLDQCSDAAEFQFVVENLLDPLATVLFFNDKRLEKLVDIILPVLTDLASSDQKDKIHSWDRQFTEKDPFNELMSQVKRDYAVMFEPANFDN